MAKSKLDEIFDDHPIIGSLLSSVPAGNRNETTLKKAIKALFLEIHLSAHNEAGSEAEAMKLFEKKVKEL